MICPDCGSGRCPKFIEYIINNPGFSSPGHIVFFKDTPKEKIEHLLTRQPDYMKDFRDTIFMMLDAPPTVFKDGIASVQVDNDVYIECIDRTVYKDVNCYMY